MAIIDKIFLVVSKCLKGFISFENFALTLYKSIIKGGNFKIHSVLYSDFFFFVFLGLKPWHMEVPRLGVESEPQLLAYTAATAVPDLSHISNLYHSSRQHGSLTHWMRPGLEPVSSWVLVTFVSAEPQWELPYSDLMDIWN